jgi:TM2 domain-containing membrane protein YozV
MTYPPPSGYGPPAGQNPAGAPYGVDPATGLPYSDKSKLVAGLLSIFLGAFGVGRFYTGHTSIAIWQIVATWLTCGLGSLWPLIDGIIVLAQGGTDSQGRVLRPN